MLINTVSDKLDIIIVAGQSNGEGYGIGPTDEPFCPSADILHMKDTDNQGYVVDEKTHGAFHITMPRDYLIGIAEERRSTSGKIGNLGLYFARKYKEECLAKDRKLLVIQCAVGATGFAKGNWGLGSVLYTRMCEMTKLALSMNKENRLVALLWHQGEHDAIFKPHLTDTEREELHLENLRAQFSDFREKFGVCPLIMGEFTDEWSRVFPKFDIIVSAMRRLAEELPQAGLASSEGLPTNNEALGNGDHMHFSRDSLRLFGERYFDIYRLIK